MPSSCRESLVGTIPRALSLLACIQVMMPAKEGHHEDALSRTWNEVNNSLLPFGYHLAERPGRPQPLNHCHFRRIPLRGHSYDSASVPMVDKQFRIESSGRHVHSLVTHLRVSRVLLIKNFQAQPPESRHAIGTERS